MNAKDRRRARRDAKKRELKCLKDESQTKDKRDEPEETQGSLPSADRIRTARVDRAATAHAQEKQSSYRTQQCKDWMLVIKAAWRGIGWLFMSVVGFLDKNNGAVTAVATIAIAFLTWQYVTYSKKQWETMQKANEITFRTLRMTQRAWIAVDFSSRKLGAFKVHDIRGLKLEDIKEVDFPMQITNRGNSPARQITIHDAVEVVRSDKPRLWYIPQSTLLLRRLFCFQGPLHMTSLLKCSIHAHLPPHSQ